MPSLDTRSARFDTPPFVVRLLAEELRLSPSRLAILSTAVCGVLVLCGCPPQNPGPSAHAGGETPVVVSYPSPPRPPVAIPPTPTPRDELVATVDGTAITTKQLDAPLIEAYGLNMLLKLVELELAKQEVARQHLAVSPQDIAEETQRYIDLVFKDDKKLSEMRDQLEQKVRDNKTADAQTLRGDIHREQQRLLSQLLEQQKVTPTEFKLGMETNTYLRRIVQNAVQLQLTDANLQERFRALYGEKVQIRQIAVANLQEVNEVKRRLADGASFQQVASDLSRDRATQSVGGEMPPFSRFAPYPQVFKDLAFSLAKPGDISEPVEVDGSYHLIQLMDRIAPTAVKFEDVKDSVRHDLAETLTDAAVKQVRAQLGQAAMKEMTIQNPVLAKQFQDKLTQRDTEIRDRDQIRREFKSQRSATTAPATAATATEPAPEAPAAPATTHPTQATQSATTTTSP